MQLRPANLHPTGTAAEVLDGLIPGPGKAGKHFFKWPQHWPLISETEGSQHPFLHVSTGQKYVVKKKKGKLVDGTELMFLFARLAGPLEPIENTHDPLEPFGNTHSLKCQLQGNPGYEAGFLTREIL